MSIPTVISDMCTYMSIPTAVSDMYVPIPTVVSDMYLALGTLVALGPPSDSGVSHWRDRNTTVRERERMEDGTPPPCLSRPPRIRPGQCMAFDVVLLRLLSGTAAATSATAARLSLAGLCAWCLVLGVLLAFGSAEPAGACMFTPWGRGWFNTT